MRFRFFLVAVAGARGLRRLDLGASRVSEFLPRDRGGPCVLVGFCCGQLCGRDRSSPCDLVGLC
jgi:hypothetical protein